MYLHAWECNNKTEIIKNITMPVYIIIFWKQVCSITYSDKGDKEVRFEFKWLLNHELITFIQGCALLLFTNTSFSIQKQHHVLF